MQLRELERLLEGNPEIAHGLEIPCLPPRQTFYEASPFGVEPERATILPQGTAPSAAAAEYVARAASCQRDLIHLLQHRSSQAKRFEKIAGEAHARASISGFDGWMALRVKTTPSRYRSDGDHEQTLNEKEELLEVSRNVLKESTCYWEQKPPERTRSGCGGIRRKSGKA